jgi:hypothetical protein
MSVTLSQDLTSAINALNLKWVVSNTDLQSLKEITLIYFRNTSDADIVSLEVEPSENKLSLEGLVSGASYTFQLQVTSLTNALVYSNSLVVTAPYFMIAPVIASSSGADDSIIIQLEATANLLTIADTVEFVIKKADNTVFWVIKPYSSARSYTLSSEDHASIMNNQTYRVACMFQPSTSNAVYTAPSTMSNSINASPSNLPNIPTSVVGSSVGTDTYDFKITWTKPSDYSEWSSDSQFQLKVVLYSSVEGLYETVYPSDKTVSEFTWSNLHAGRSFKGEVSYINSHGTGPSAESSYTALTKTPGATTLVSAVAGDAQVSLSWLASSDTGNSAITAYEVYRNGLLISTLSATSMTDSGLVNGISYSYAVKARNALGAGVLSSSMSATPFGNVAIDSVVLSGKQLTITVRPNGNAVSGLYLVALDSDPHPDTDSSFFIDVPQMEISQVTTGTVQVVKSFSSFTTDISFWCVMVKNAVSTASARSV